MIAIYYINGDHKDDRYSINYIIDIIYHRDEACQISRLDYIRLHSAIFSI